MPVINFDSRYPINGIFAGNILHFTLTLHAIPMADLIQKVMPPDNQRGIMTLTTKQSNLGREFLSIFLDELPVQELLENEDMLKEIHQLAGNVLINGCYEKAKREELLKNDHHEIVQFFRHLRNAASHGGVFHITKISNSARWRNLKVSMDWHGQPIYDFLAIGDLLLFLQDLDEYLMEKREWTMTPKKSK